MKNQLLIGQRLLNEFPGNSCQRDFDSALPARIGLPCEFPNVDVDKPSLRWPLCQRAVEVRRLFASNAFYIQCDLKGKIAAIRPLRLYRCVGIPFAVLDAEIHTSWRSNQDDAKRDFL